MGQIMVQAGTERIVRVTGGTYKNGEEYLLQRLEDDHGGSQRWADFRQFSVEEMAFGFTHGWGTDCHPLWKETRWLQVHCRAPEHEGDVLTFAVEPMGRYVEGHCSGYRVAFGAWNSPGGGLNWEHRPHGNGGLWVAKQINHRALGPVSAELKWDADSAEILQVLLKLRVMLGLDPAQHAASKVRAHNDLEERCL